MEEHREEAAGLLDQSGCFQNQVVLKGGSVTQGKAVSTKTAVQPAGSMAV